MTVPSELVQDVREHRCVGLIDKTKSAQQRPFGVLRDRVVHGGVMYLLIDGTADSVLNEQGFKKYAGMRGSVWWTTVSGGCELDAIYEKSKKLRCSSFAIIISWPEFLTIFSLFSSAGVITNSRSGYGARAARFSNQVSTRSHDSAVLCFDARSDIFRLYYDYRIVDEVIISLAELNDYKNFSSCKTNGILADPDSLNSQRET